MGLLVVLVVLVVLFWNKIWTTLNHYRRIQHFANKMPGPNSLKFIWHLLMNCRNLEQCHDHLMLITERLQDEGHDIACVWIFNRLMICPLSGKAVKNVVESTKEIAKSPDYDGLRPWLGTGLLMTHGDEWRTRRRLLTPTFHFSLLEGYFDTYNTHAQIMIDILERKVGDGRVEMDVVPYIKRFGLDVVYESVMGVPLNTQLNPDSAYSEAMEKLMGIAAELFLAPHLRNSFLWWLTGVGARYQAALDVLKAASTKCIVERKAARARGDFNHLLEDRPCFLDQMLDLVEQDKLSVADVSDEVDTFMFGGHDTSSTSASWTLWCLACHPDIQEKVYEEVNAVFEGDTSRPVTSTDISKMSLLDRVVKEGLRLFPPVPIAMRELEGDLDIGQYTVPAGATIFLSFVVLHHNKYVFDSPSSFDPDRFLPERTMERDPHDFIPFSAGPRNCIGQRFARNELKVLLSSLLRKFKFSTDRPFDSEKGSPEIVYRAKNGIRIHVEKRHN